MEGKVEGTVKKGILVVSFGTTYRDTREKNIEVLEQEIQETYPDMVVYRAFSSSIIRRILRERDGILVMDAEEALEKMKEDGIEQVYIQPTHIIDGIENHGMKRVAQQWKSEFEILAIGNPLLAEPEDYKQTAEILWSGLSPDAEHKSLIFIGHGTSHESNEAYVKLEQTFLDLGHPHVYMSTVEAEPDMEAVMKRLDQEEKRDVLLTPFMLVAGDHAIHDMAGEEDSYMTALTEAGYQVQVILKGLGEYPEIRKLYLSHLKAAMDVSYDLSSGKL